jgi:hypothetical protein
VPLCRTRHPIQIGQTNISQTSYDPAMRETPIGTGLSAASAECGTQAASQPIRAVCAGMGSAGSPTPAMCQAERGAEPGPALRRHAPLTCSFLPRSRAAQKLCSCETCRARCRRCKVSQVLLALCLSAVSYYDDAMSEVEPARGPFNIAYSGFKRDPAVRRLCSGGGDAPQPAELAT